MKKKLAIALAVFTATCIFSAISYGQQRSTVLGGFKAAKTTQAGVKEAAEFAVKATGEKEEKEMELVSVLKAETQTVAGTNYRLCLKVSSEGGEGQDAVEIFVQTVVYMDLKKNYKLTSWAISDCGDDLD